MGSIRVKAELILGVGEFLEIDETVSTGDLELDVRELIPAGTNIQQITGSSLMIVSDDPVNTDILDGTPQTNVRLLLLIADPV